jgi:hypothetical protein
MKIDSYWNHGEQLSIATASPEDLAEVFIRHAVAIGRSIEDEEFTFSSPLGGDATHPAEVIDDMVRALAFAIRRGDPS